MSKRRLIILFGSQTGTAQEVAERIWRESKWYHFHGPVLPMDEYPIQQLIYEPLVIFICSTTGQGEQPDNMKRFWKFLLRRNLPTESLQGLQFAVLGLGDSSYQCFNYVAKKLCQRLVGLGGSMIHSLGLADEQHDLGLDFTVDPWISDLWSQLGTLFPLAGDVQPIDKDILPQPRWLVETLEGFHHQHDAAINDIGSMNTCVATVLGNTRTTADSHWQDVRLIQLSTVNVAYTPGDVVNFVPHNLPVNMERLFKILEGNKSPLSRWTTLNVSPLDTDIPVPAHLCQPVTVRECAEKYWDLSAVPRRYLFQLLAHFTTSTLEREKLRELTSAAGQEELYNYANRPRRSVIETLIDFPYASENIPVEYLFEVFQPIRPRSFSIASSPSAHRDQLHVLVAIVKYKTKLVDERLGLCSNWLATLQPGDQVPISVRSGSFKFPSDPNVAVIMVGPGTGVAPFRSYISQCVADANATDKKLVLFFGCRQQAADFHCQQEWKRMQSDSRLTLFCAFSRDQQDKVYVQHLIMQHGALICDLIRQQGAHIYVAGSSKNMPQAVRDAFIQALQTQESLTEDEATQVLTELQASDRYQCETWA